METQPGTGETNEEAGNQGAGMTHRGRRKPKRKDIRRTENMNSQDVTELMERSASHFDSF